ncbi:4Fe-4S cluster-binding domain-containing protein, partial [Candidatus Bathyarchaeota archaeon]|nr:4Fe-4S cluster-binding domain-containing protein [Candidatus Bathyarchaeota archaeon]
MVCDLNCKYCFSGSINDIDSDFNFKIDYSLPREINYNVKLLADFCEKDPDRVLSFYGGEPTLCTQKVKEIMDKVKAKYFLIQTNALHLDEIESEYINRFHTISASIDGCRELTDYYRGEGVYQKAIENLRSIIRNGFKGEVIARRTVMEETDIVKEI